MDKEHVMYTHIHNGILLTCKKNEIMPFVATWMDLEIIILSEIRERQTSYNISHMWNLIFLKNGTNELIYKAETDLRIVETMCGSQRRNIGRHKSGAWNEHPHSTTYKVDI